MAIKVRNLNEMQDKCRGKAGSNNALAKQRVCDEVTQNLGDFQ